MREMPLLNTHGAAAALYRLLGVADEHPKACTLLLTLPQESAIAPDARVVFQEMGFIAIRVPPAANFSDHFGNAFVTRARSRVAIASASFAQKVGEIDLLVRASPLACEIPRFVRGGV